MTTNSASRTPPYGSTAGQHLTFMGVGLLTAFAAFLFGSLFGFLFGIPKIVSSGSSDNVAASAWQPTKTQPSPRR